MKDPKTRKGRPPTTDKGKEKKRLDDLFKNIPNHIKSQSAQINPILGFNIKEYIDEARKGLGLDASCPDNLILDMCSLEHDEFTKSDVEEILAQHDLYKSMNLKKTYEATKALKNKTTLLAKSLWDKNQDLVEQIASNKRTVNDAAALIHKLWEKRGIDVTDPNGRTIKPTQRTLRNWYELIHMEKPRD